MPDIVEVFFYIFTGTAILASLALWARQPLIVAYILLGMLLGPYALNLVNKISLLDQLSHIGIIFLLFLLGLDMQPKALFATLKKSLFVVFCSSAIFWSAATVIILAFGFVVSDAIIIGAAVIFSSTILGIKLLPTTALHHRHIGELIVGILLVQDILAIILLSVLINVSSSPSVSNAVAMISMSIPLLAVACFAVVRYLILPLISKFDRVKEYIFLLSIGWCLGVAELAKVIGLSYEIGAFFAGISLASSPISQFIALSLKPLRDFFLVLFFFALGASFNFALISEVWIPAITLATALLIIKPITFRILLRNQSESRTLSWDIGFRLGQISEFGILIGVIAASNDLLSDRGTLLLQSSAILCFLISSYIIVFNLTNPMSPHPNLRRD